MSDFLPVFSSTAGEAAFKSAYQAVLQRWSAPFTEQWIETSFGTVHVIASGPEEAPPLVLLHAYFASAAVWYPNAEALSQNHRVFAVDILGDANLSRPTRPITSLAEIRQSFVELFTGLKIQQATLVGNSFGGFCAVSLAMQMPEAVKSLVLISPAATFHGILPFYLHVFMPKFVNLMLPKIPGQEQRIRRGMDWAYAGLPPDAWWDNLFYQALLHGTGAIRIFPRTYKAEDFRKIASLPALLLVGDHEKIYQPQDVIRSAKKLFPGITAEVVPGAHHIAALANPEKVNRLILGFLEKEPDFSPTGKISSGDRG